MVSIIRYLFLILLFNVCCERENLVSPDTFVKMISHRNLGLAYLEEERFSDAVKEFKALIDLHPQEPLGYANLGLTYMLMSGELKNSEEWLSQALKKSPNNPDILFLQSKLYELTDRKDKAIINLENLIIKHPTHIRSLYQLGIIYSRDYSEDKNQEAIKYISRVCEEVPGNIAASLKLIELLIENKNGEDALYQLQNLIQTLPNLSDASTKLIMKITSLLHENKIEESRVPMIMLHNLLKPIDIYQSSISKLRGTSGPIAGSPLFHFLNTKAKDKENHFEKNVTFKNISEKVKLNLINDEINSSNEDRSNSLIFALADHDLDGDVDLYVSSNSIRNKLSRQFFLENRAGKFFNQSSLANIKHSGFDISAKFSDYDNDGYQDLFICNSSGDKLYRNMNNGKYVEQKNTGIKTTFISQSALFLDLDLEGDLDLFLATEKANRYFRNNSDGTFSDMSKQFGIENDEVKSIRISFSDFDDDGDVDLFVLNENGTFYLYDNLRQGRFENISKKSGLRGFESPYEALICDYNNDGLEDIFIADNKKYFLFKNLGELKFELDIIWGSLKNNSEVIPYGGPAKFADVNNDGYEDLILSGFVESKKSSVVFLFYNHGNGSFSSSQLIIEDFSHLINQIEINDYDNDGDLDLFLSTLNNEIHLYENVGGNINNYIKIELTGLRTGSGKNNYFGIGSKLELKAGEIYQMKYVDEPSIHFGIGNKDSADVIRTVWSNGVPQNRFKPQKNQKIVEKQVLKGSCPYLFGWSGKNFDFITDVLWPSALGMPLGIMAGEINYAFPNSTNEYLMVPGEKLKPFDNSYLLQFTTELWETPYLDKIRLMVIDHPSDIDIFIDETFYPPPFPKFRVYHIKEKHPPIKAEDSNGINLLKKISKKDNNYVSNLYSDLYQGVTKLHELILEFDNLNTEDSLFLFLQGWLFPTDASINVNLSQIDSLKSIFPYLQIPDQNGNWKTINNNMGFPKGKNKTMIVDLTNKFVDDDFRLKIRTNMQIYWDYAFIGSPLNKSEMFKSELVPTYANLHYRGFSNTEQKDYSSPHIPDYYSVKKGQKWRDLIGKYTRYGDVLELLMESDNKYVIMNAGDEITLKFDTSNLTDLPNDWDRDFLFYNDGWLKDGDLNTAKGKTVMPLPFHGMESYPKGAENKYPSDREYDFYREKYNTRLITTKNFRNFIRHMDDE